MLVNIIIVGVVAMVAGFVLGAIYSRSKSRAKEVVDPAFKKRIEEIDDRILRLQVDIRMDGGTGDGKSK